MVFTWYDRLSKVHQFQWLNPSHHMFVREHIGRIGIGIESGTGGIYEDDATAGSEIDGQLEVCDKAGSTAIERAAGPRGSHNFRASGLVYPSALTCALSTHHTSFCSPLQVPMLCIDGASEPDLLCEHPRLRWCTIQWPAGLPRPSFTMAAVGRIAASMRCPSGSACSGCTCPGLFPDKFHLELVGHHPQPGPSWHSQGA